MERAGRKTLGSASDIISFKYFRAEMKIWALTAYKVDKHTQSIHKAYRVEPETEPQVIPTFRGKRN